MTTNVRIDGDSRHLTDLLASRGLSHLIGQVPCVVGSPPYNVDIDYPAYRDFVPWPAYWMRVRAWSRAIHDVLCDGGRAWIVVSPSVPQRPRQKSPDRVNLAAMWSAALVEAGLHYRDCITWVQDAWDGRCQWGSWLQPSSPNMRGSTELVLCYFKRFWARPAPARWKAEKMPRHDLGGDWGTDLCRNVWSIPPAKGKGAPFPIELPARAIRLSTWPDEWVVDPWGGTGTTERAAEELGRSSVLVDVGWGDA